MFDETELLLIASIYEQGSEVSQNFRFAREFYKKASLFNNPETQFKLAQYYCEAYPGLERNPEEAFRLCMSAAKQGCIEAVDMMERLKDEVSDELQAAFAKFCSSQSVQSVRYAGAERLFQVPVERNQRPVSEMMNLLGRLSPR